MQHHVQEETLKRLNFTTRKGRKKGTSVYSIFFIYYAQLSSAFLDSHMPAFKGDRYFSSGDEICVHVHHFLFPFITLVHVLLVILLGEKKCCVCVVEKRSEKCFPWRSSTQNSDFRFVGPFYFCPWYTYFLFWIKKGESEWKRYWL